MIILIVDKHNSTSWREVKAVEVTEQELSFFDSENFFTRKYEDIRFAQLILPDGSKVYIYSEEKGGN